MQTLQADYFAAYPSLNLTRDSNGVLTVEFHTNDGPFMGNAPTGKKVSVRGMQISRFANGRLVERWGSSDQLGMLQQLGLS